MVGGLQEGLFRQVMRCYFLPEKKRRLHDRRYHPDLQHLDNPLQPCECAAVGAY